MIIKFNYGFRQSKKLSDNANAYDIIFAQHFLFKDFFIAKYLSRGDNILGYSFS